MAANDGLVLHHQIKSRTKPDYKYPNHCPPEKKLYVHIPRYTLIPETIFLLILNF